MRVSIVSLVVFALVLVLSMSCDAGGGGTPSTAATLFNLAVSEGTLSPAFDSSVCAYTVTVANSVDAVTVVASPSSDAATVTGDGEHSLVVGENSITVSVVAEDGVTSMAYALTVTREADGPAAEEIHMGAITVLTSVNDAMTIYQGGGEYPAGVTLDDTNYDLAQGGIMVITFSEYALPESDATISGTITVDTTFYWDQDPVLFESRTAGSVSYTGFPVEACTLDVTLTADMDDVPLWETATWTGSITVDGHEADLDGVMTEHIALLQEAGF